MERGGDARDVPTQSKGHMKTQGEGGRRRLREGARTRGQLCRHPGLRPPAPEPWGDEGGLPASVGFAYGGPGRRGGACQERTDR